VDGRFSRSAVMAFFYYYSVSQKYSRSYLGHLYMAGEEEKDFEDHFAGNDT
jgi:hypothetical protein